MKPSTTLPTHTLRKPTEALTIRMAVPADIAALIRLAELDSARPPGSTPTLVAEVGGELRAALPLDGRPPIADPFHLTAELLAMLVERARQLAPQASRRPSRRWRLVGAPRPAPVPRV